MPTPGTSLTATGSRLTLEQSREEAVEDSTGAAVAFACLPAPPYLSCREEVASPRCWPLLGPRVTVGRAPDVDVVLADDLLVSRLHATLELVAGVWTVVDEGLSRNGTYVNGRRLTGRSALHDRDELRVGTTTLTFCAPSEVTGAHTMVGTPMPVPTHLTPAQRAVVLALCRPYKDGQAYALPATNAQIAEELFLSVDAVKTHLRVLFHRLDIDHLPQNTKRVRLAEMALLYGLVSKSEL